MLYTTNTQTQEVRGKGLINLGINQIHTSCITTHSPESTVITLNRPGFYMVHFNADAYVGRTGRGGIVGVQLLANGDNVPGATASRYAVGAEEPTNVGFTAIVQVLPNCPSVIDNNPLNLTFQNLTTETTYTNVGVTVTKLK